MHNKNWLTVAAAGLCWSVVCAISAWAQQAGEQQRGGGDDFSAQQRERDEYDARTRRGQPPVAAPRTGSRRTADDADGASGRNERYTARRATADYGEHAHTDQQLAAWLLVDNRGEIALAQLAQEKSSNSEVRKFAQHLIDDHSKTVEKLERFAGTHQRTRGGDNRETGNRETGNRETGNRETGNRRQGANEQFAAGGQARTAAGLNFTRIKQQLGQQCLASSKRELEQKDDHEFDECFIGMQIAKHMEMIDTLKVFSHYASENLDQVIEEGEQAAEEHLDHAKELIKQLTAGGHHGAAHSSSSGTRESTNERTATRTGATDTEKRDSNRRNSTERDSDTE